LAAVVPPSAGQAYSYKNGAYPKKASLCGSGLVPRWTATQPSSGIGQSFSTEAALPYLVTNYVKATMIHVNLRGDREIMLDYKSLN